MKYKNFLIIFLLLLLIIVVYRYNDFILNKNFTLQVNTFCDSNLNCFTSESDDISFGQNPYKKVTITARAAPKCLEEHNCDSFYCSDYSGLGIFCEEVYCSNDNINEGEECLTK